MPQPDSSPSLLPCDRCGALVDAYEAQAVTVNHRSGAYRLWTHQRAAAHARNVVPTEHLLVYLCQTCTHELFPGDRQTDATAGE